MRKVALRNLAAHKVRLALTVLSVILGTAFIAGSFVFTDTLQRTFDGLFANQAKGVDVRVSPRDRQAQGIPNAVVDQLNELDGVRAVAPGVNGVVVLLTPDGKKAIQTGGVPSGGKSYIPPDRAVAEPDKYVQGVPPARPGEVAINTGGADKAGLHLGDRTKVLVPTQGDKPIDLLVTGIYDIPGDTGGFIQLQFTDTQARQLFTDGYRVAYVDIAAANGVKADTLRDAIAKKYPDFKVQNAAQVRADLRDQISTSLNFINYFLLAFGAIALIVGTFIIYNTFSMIVAQRLRELALLRAVGASRRQVGNSVVVEALVIGLLGSAIGLAAGVGLAYGVSALLNAFQLGLPTGSLAVRPRTIVIGLLVGLVVTVGSAYAPARRAALIPPVQAMREEFAALGESLRLRTLIGAALGAAGVLVVALGARGTGKTAAIIVGIGALALILAVLLAAPWVSRPVLRVLGVFTRPLGAIGLMARNNAVRNPRRTAATAFALTLGLMLVTAIAMLGASAKASIGVLVDKGVKADYVLTGPQFIGVPLGVIDAARKTPGVADVVGLRGVSMKAGNDQLFGISPDGDLAGGLNYDLLAGSGALGPNDVLVAEEQAAQYGWHVGEKITLNSMDGKPRSLTVTGIYKKQPMLGSFLLPPDLYFDIVPKNFQQTLFALVTAKPGADPTQLRADLEKSTEQFTIVQVQNHEEFKGFQGQQINRLLAILYGLLALAVIIAILGIVNTLALSVVERRREIGMLRAVGMQRAQVRRTIYLESMLIAIFGALVGMALGLGLGAGFLRTLRDLGLDQIEVPWTQLVVVLVASGVVGVLAALWPGVRAARTPPLAAIADL
ncbi:FtsX-like permease family protein [Nocardia panacis]|uniref:FtsX-like permease family protein n=2 Tax=Nocardia panacis TaxID=2340916 RepID=A0A3A4KGR5_9NOCA|nr:FtsX-like permease family protein [Nocardia panacis]